MARDKDEPTPTPVVDRTPLGHVFLTGIVFALGYIAVTGSAKLIGRAFRSDAKALPEGE